MSDEDTTDEEAGDPLIRRFERWDRDLDMKWGPWKREARLWFELVSGEQWDSRDKADLIDAMRVPVVFNRVEPMIDAVSGAEISNRQQTTFYAREVGDAQAQEVVAAALDYERDACDAEDEESDAARDALICGLGWVEHRISDEDDPNGEILWSKVDPFEMAPDPQAKRKNLTDARYLRRVRELTREEYRQFKADLQSAAEAEVGGDDEEAGDVKHNEPHDAYQGDDDDQGGKPSDLVKVREYQWIEREVVPEESDWRVKDPTTGRQVVLSAQQHQKLAAQFARHGMALEGQQLPRKVVYRAFVCGKQVLAQGRLPKVSSFTYKAITGKRDQTRGTWYGAVRAMVDPQRFVNALFSQLLNIIDSSAKGGYWYEAGAITDPEEFEDKCAEVGANIELAPNALAEGRIKSRAEMNWPAGYDRLLQFTWTSFPWVTGVNPNLFGMASEAGESGVLDAQRTRQAYGVLSWFFDSLRRYRKQSGRLSLELLSLIEPGKVVRVVRQDQAQYVPLAFDGEVRKYDIVIDEAPDSPSQKDRVFSVMMQLAPILKQMQIPPAAMAEFIRYSPLPASMNEALAKAITDAGNDPAAAQAKQLALAGEHAKVKKTEADAQLSAAKAASEANDGPIEQMKARVELEKLQLEREKIALEREKIPLEYAQLQADIAISANQALASDAKTGAAVAKAKETGSGGR